MTIKSHCSSANGIVITEDMLVPRPQLPPDDVGPKLETKIISAADADAIFVRLRALKREFGAKPNMHELAQALIGACILEGFDTRARIVAALHRLNLNKAHVVMTLNQHDGDGWQCDSAGVYHLLDGLECIVRS